MRPEFTKKPEFMQLAAEQKKTDLPLFIELFRFFLVLILAMLAEGVLFTIPEIIWLSRSGRISALFEASLSGGSIEETVYSLIGQTPPWLMAVMGILSITLGIAAIIYCRFFEKRSLKTMGLVRQHALRHFAVGMLLGAVLFSAGVGLAVLFRGVRIERFAIDTASLPLLLLFLFSFLLQGIGEGLLLHGYFAVSLSKRLRLSFCIFITSLLYMSMHQTGLGPYWVGTLNYALFGALLGLLMLKTGDLWGIFGLRMVWSFFAANVFSFTPDGPAESYTLFQGTVIGHNELLTGGSAGLECSLCVTVVLLAAIGALIWLLLKNAPEQTPEAEAAE